MTAAVPAQRLAPATPASPARALSDVLADADRAVQAGGRIGARTWATGFRPLDACLGGGLRAGELTLVGGAQGLGKTTFTLQIARNVAAAGGTVTYVCYEHDERDLLARLLGMEAGLALGHEAADLAGLRAALDKEAASGQGLVDRLGWCAGGEEAVEGLASYADRLHLVCAGGRRLDLEGVRELVHTAAPGPVVIDYLQKIALPGDVPDEAERVTRIVETLKDLAMETARPVVAIVASDRAGIGGAVRTRLSHLRGSSALAYEADAALLLNNKFSIVSRNHLMYGGGDAERFREWVVCSIEKNRAGGSGVDLEFRTHLSRGHYDPQGGWVSESLVDDRVHTE